MRRFLPIFVIFSAVFFVYFAVGTNYTFKPKWALDYFNPLAQSILQLRLDIPNTASTYDLSYYNGKWYVPWGILTSIFLIPLQLIKGHYVPILYLSVFFSSLNIVFVYLLLQRLKKEFLPKLSFFAMFIFLTLFAFGTTHFYVGTLGSSWHVNQMVTAFLGTLGIYIIFKKNRTIKDYILSSIILSSALLGRFTIAMLLVLPLSLYFWDYFSTEKIKISNIKFLRNLFLIFFTPLIFFILLVLSYNYLRFNNPLEFGYSYIHEAPYLAQIREENGLSSYKNIAHNAWYMLFEIPSFTFSDKFNFNFNLNGNSIFFLTLPLLTIFWASPFRIKKKLIVDPYISSLWLAAVITIIPSLLHYSSGWMQFGYRYSLDITVLLIILSVFGMRGKVNFLYILGTVFSIIIYIMGINALM